MKCGLVSRYFRDVLRGFVSVVWGGKVGIFEELNEFYNCLTIYYWYWLRDILKMRRSGYRTRIVNCVEI